MDTFSQTASAFLDLEDDSEAELHEHKTKSVFSSVFESHTEFDIRSISIIDSTKKRVRPKTETANDVERLLTELKRKVMTPQDAELVKLQLLSRSLRHRGKRQCMCSMPSGKLPPKKIKMHTSSESEDDTKSSSESIITSAEDCTQDEMDSLFGCSKCRFQWSGCEECKKEEPMVRRPKIRWKPESLHYQSVPSAPIYHPSEEEFHDPFKYISEIRSEAEKYGICTIVPPDHWTSLFNPQVDCKDEDCQFYPKRQFVSSLCFRNADRGAPNGHPGRYSNEKENSSVSSDDEFGFSASEMPFSVLAFKAFADWAHHLHFNSSIKETKTISVRETEGEFWRLVEGNSNDDFETFYGSDLDSRKFRKSMETNTKGHVHWEVSRWSRSPRSLLKQIPGDDLITGVMVPWIYFGSCLSAFCWHVEDHALYSVNYHHVGAPKIWYGVPSSAAHDFELAMKDALPHLFDTDPQLLHKLVTHLSPQQLQKRGIPVYRIEHNPGTFVVTFPNSYHGGFNSGWNCAEAVNFAPADWLPHGTDVLKKYRMQKKPTTFSHDALLINLVSSIQTQNSMDGVKAPEVDPLTMKYAVGELSLRIREEERRRKVAFEEGILDTKRMEGRSPSNARDDNGVIKNTEDMDCEICKCDLFLSAVISSEKADSVVCPEHTANIPASRVLLYRYEISELQKMVDEAMKVFPDCEDYIIQAFHRVNTQRSSSFIQQGPLYEMQTL
eukprot:g3928.t1